MPPRSPPTVRPSKVPRGESGSAEEYRGFLCPVVGVWEFEPFGPHCPGHDLFPHGQGSQYPGAAIENPAFSKLVSIPVGGGEEESKKASRPRALGTGEPPLCLPWTAPPHTHRPRAAASNLTILSLSLCLYLSVSLSMSGWQNCLNLAPGGNGGGSSSSGRVLSEARAQLLL